MEGLALVAVVVVAASVHHLALVLLEKMIFLQSFWFSELKFKNRSSVVAKFE